MTANTLTIPSLPPDVLERVERDPLGALLECTQCAFAAQVRQVLEKGGRRKELPNPPHMLLVTVRRMVRHWLRGAALQQESAQAPETPDRRLAAARQYMQTLTAQILKQADDYGPALRDESARQYDFVHDAEATGGYAEFSALREKRRDGTREAQELLRDPDPFFQFAAGNPRPTLMAGDARIAELWAEPNVRAAFARERHMEWIGSIRSRRLINLSDYSTDLLNEIHSHVYGNAKRKASGAFLSGDPGEGKTSVFVEYFRLNGQEPLVMTMDPGQSAFTLFSRTTLGTERGLEGVRSLIDTVLTLPVEDLRALYRRDEALFRLRGIEPAEMELMEGEEVRKAIVAKLASPLQDTYVSRLSSVLRSGEELRGKAMGPVLQAAQELPSGRPVIIDEAVEMRDFSVFNNLLTAVPATDAEAGPMPSFTPEKGQSMPVGWYFDLQMGWLRVRENFCICMTGNLGQKFGNAGIAQAWMDRFGSGFLQVPLSSSGADRDREDLAAIVWPNLCEPETGKFLFTPGVAYRVHFFVTQFLPRIRSWMQEQFVGVSLPLTRRFVLRFSQNLIGQQKDFQVGKIREISIDEAVMASLIRPSCVPGLRESLPYFVAMLQAGGFLGSADHKAEIKRMLPEEESRITELVATAQQDRSGAPQYRYDAYSSNAEHFDGECEVCAVKRCPCHGAETRQDAEFATHAKRLSSVGVDRAFASALRGWQERMVKEGHWNLFTESYVHDSTAPGIKFPRERVLAHIAAAAEECRDAPEMAAERIGLLAGARTLHLLPDAVMTPEMRNAIRAYWSQRLLESAARIPHPLPSSRRRREAALQAIGVELRQHVEPAARVLRGLASFEASPPPLSDEVRSALRRAVPYATACLLTEIRGLDAADGPLATAVTEHARQRGTQNALRKELTDARTLMFPAPNQGGKADAYEAYGEVIHALQIARALQTLGIAKQEDVETVAGYAQTLVTLPEGTQQPSMLAAVRVLGELAAVRQLDVRASLEYFSALQAVKPPALPATLDF